MRSLGGTKTTNNTAHTLNAWIKMLSFREDLSKAQFEWLKMLLTLGQGLAPYRWPLTAFSTHWFVFYFEVEVKVLQEDTFQLKTQ